MKKKYSIRAFFLIYAVLLFATAWISFRNFGTVTYTYRLENSNMKTDFRFFQYVPGNRVKVVSDGAEKNPSIVLEKAGRGTVVMIEGHGLGEEDSVQNITLTYSVDLLSLSTAMPSLETYWKWVQEYRVRARMPLNIDRMASGNSIIEMEQVDMNCQFNDQNLLRFMVGAAFGVLAIILGFCRCRIRWTESGEYAADYLIEKESEYDAELWAEEERIAGECIDTFMRRREKYYLIFMITLFTVSTIFLPMGPETKWASYLVVAVVCVAGLRWCGILMVKAFNNLSKILTEECRPRITVKALTKLYGTRQMMGLRVRYMYAYQSLISLGYYYGGEFQCALEHLELVWKDLPAYYKKSAYQIHYHMTRMECCRLLQNEAAADAERGMVEDYLQRHPKQETSVYAKRYRKQMQIAALAESGDYQGAEKLLMEDAASGNPRYIQVAAHYSMWCIARLQEDGGQMRLHEEFIERYGREMFYYGEIKKIAPDGETLR